MSAHPERIDLAVDVELLDVAADNAIDLRLVEAKAHVDQFYRRAVERLSRSSATMREPISVDW